MIYFAIPGFEHLLERELINWDLKLGTMYVKANCTKPIFWVQDIWFDAEKVEINSISDGVKKLKKRGKYWSFVSMGVHRRGLLIQENLPKVKGLADPLSFPPSLLPLPMRTGEWGLTEPQVVFCAEKFLSPFSHGVPNFLEDKLGPPSRAYLKLWEAFYWLGSFPKSGDRCVDLGSSPGGWTWVFAKHLGVRVLSMDRAPLVAQMMKDPNVEFRMGNAFQFLPETLESHEVIDWLCSDVICYPDKLLDFVQSWINSGKVRNMIITIKFQGDEHFGIEHQFSQIPGSRVVHLYHNKHELTFLWRK